MLSKLVRTGFARTASSGMFSRLPMTESRVPVASRSFLSSTSSSSSSSSSTLSRLLLLAPITAAVAYRQFSDQPSLLPKSGAAE